jgi:hypothetical protein
VLSTTILTRDLRKDLRIPRDPRDLRDPRVKRGLRDRRNLRKDQRVPKDRRMAFLPNLGVPKGITRGIITITSILLLIPVPKATTTTRDITGILLLLIPPHPLLVPLGILLPKKLWMNPLLLKLRLKERSRETFLRQKLHPRRYSRKHSKQSSQSLKEWKISPTRYGSNPDFKARWWTSLRYFFPLEAFLVHLEFIFILKKKVKAIGKIAYQNH